MSCEAGSGISVYRGDSHTVEVTAKRKDSSGALVVQSIAGSTSVLTVKRRPGDSSAVISRAGTIANPPGTNGLLRFELLPSDTAALIPGNYVYDVQLTLPGSKVYTLSKGVFGLLEDVTGNGDSALPTPPPTPPAASVASGWLSIVDVAVPGGMAANKTYDDAPNNTIIQSCTVSSLSVELTIKSSAPRVGVGATIHILPPHASGGYYTGTAATTLAESGDLIAQLVTPDGATGAFDTVSITLVPPPSILTLAFVGAYPGSQTELKAGDTVQVTGTTDVAAVGIQALDFGACILQDITFASSTSFTATLVVADRGTSTQALSARIRARDANGAYGATFDTTNTRQLNNTYPSVVFGAKTYPVGQLALKNSETADVAVTVTSADAVLFDSPNSELSIAAPTTIAASKTVTRIAGSYNVSTNNLRASATRAANGANTIAQTVVSIANVAPSVAISVPAARLRSGGNDGTSIQSHVITATVSQQLLLAPSLVAGAGAFAGGGFAGGPSTWTRTLQIHDNDTKGSYAFSGLSATGLSGIEQTTIASGASFVLGGFVARSLTFSPFSQTTTLNVGVVDYAKLQAGIFTATNQPALKNATQGNHSAIANTYTVDSLGNVGPTTLFWNDAAAASSNSSGTAQITAVEEVV